MSVAALARVLVAVVAVLVAAVAVGVVVVRVAAVVVREVVEGGMGVGLVAAVRVVLVA